MAQVEDYPAISPAELLGRDQVHLDPGKRLERLQRDIIWETVSTGDAVFDAVVVDGGLSETGQWDVERLKRYEVRANRLRDQEGEPILLVSELAEVGPLGERVDRVEAAYGNLDDDQLTPYTEQTHGRMAASGLPVLAATKLEWSRWGGPESTLMPSFISAGKGGIPLVGQLYDYDVAEKTREDGYQERNKVLVGQAEIAQWVQEPAPHDDTLARYWMIRHAALMLLEQPIDLSEQLAEQLAAEQQRVEKLFNFRADQLEADHRFLAELDLLAGTATKFGPEQWRAAFLADRRRRANKLLNLGMAGHFAQLDRDHRDWPYMDLSVSHREYAAYWNSSAHMVGELKREIYEIERRLKRITAYTIEMGIGITRNPAEAVPNEQ